ncbi:TPA: hypothetical protein HA295_01550 [Candidatus Woesearchaeota archaeon]|nr:hypothetical protein [Candidatus Woesearchaeota archaeon]
MRLSIFLCALAALLAGCAGYAVKDVPEVLREQGPDPGVFFCKQDNCSWHLEELILSAQSSVHCAFYDLDLQNIIAALGEQSRHAEVRVVLDDEPYEGMVSGDGVLVEDRSSRMHNKFCVVDGMYVWTGSFNPTTADNDVNDNNAVLMSSYYLAKNYEQEFGELWMGEFSAGSRVPYPSFVHNGMLVENAFCPEDRCEEKVASLLGNASVSVYVMVFSFTSEKIADAMLFRRDAEMRGVFDSSQAGSSYSQYRRLLGFGLPVRKDRGKGKLHHKVFIIDNETVITGSYNPTASGSGENDENVLILHNQGIARRYAGEFFRLWEAAS